MFKTKIRGFTFGLIMSYAMAIGMEIYNMALKYGFQAQPGGLSGLSYAAVGEALTETLYMGLLVLLFSNLWGNRAGDAFRRRHCDAGRDNPYFRQLMRQAGTVMVMCPSMSLVASILFSVILTGAPLVNLPAIWLGTVLKNFPMAFFWCFFAAAPFTHWLFGLIFRTKNA